jgi:integrase
MARQLNMLSPKKAEAIRLSGRYADGGGLYLSIGQQGQRRWVFLYDFQGKRREMGLGSAGKDGVSLKAAREKAEEARKLKREGIDPLGQKHAMQAEQAASDNAKTFADLADDHIATHGPSWRNAKHRDQWVMTLRDYAAPLRPMLPADIRTEHVLDVLKPLWLAKPETAQRLRGRIEAVLNRAITLRLCEGPNPAIWRGHLSNLLPKGDKLARGHHAALPHAELPAFMASLRERQGESMAALALEFCILTAARTSEVLGARWDEIDMQAGVWTVPAIRMKAKREHRVPLSSRALAILAPLSEAKLGPYVFPASTAAKPMSGMAMVMLLRRMQREDITVHGFRATFSTWVSEATNASTETREQALAHAIANKVDAAYRRGDQWDKRLKLMEQWATFAQPKAENVISLGKRA